MADIDVAEFLEDTVKTHTGDTTYTTALTVAAANWEAGAKYLVLMTARVKADTNAVAGWIMNREDGGDIVHSEMIGEDQRLHYPWWGIYDAPNPAEDIYFQHKLLSDSGATVESDSMALLKIRLDADLVENTDWRFDDDTSVTNPEATYTTFAAIASYTPGTPADHRLILGLVRIQANSNNRFGLFHLEENVNGTGWVEIGGEFSMEGEDLAEEWMYAVAWVDESGSAGTREYRIQTKNADTVGNHTHVYSAIFVLELNAFADHDEDQNTTPLTGTDALQVLNVIDPYTPTTTGDQVFITFSNTNPNAGDQWKVGMVEQDDVIVDADWDDDSVNRSNDVTDQLATFRARLLSVGSSGEKLEHTGDALSTSGTWDERSLAVFSVALAAGGTTVEQTNTGAISTITGALAKKPLIVRAGAATPTGALAREPQIVRTGSDTPTGSLSKQAQVTFEGSDTPTGALTVLKTLLQTVTGAISVITGALSVKVLKALAGSDTPTGSLNQKPAVTFEGADTPTGSLDKEPSVTFKGTVTSAGVLTNLKAVLLSVAGTLTSAGALAKKVFWSRGGTVASSGILNKIPQTIFEGTVTSVGGLTKKVLKALAGALATAGSLATVAIISEAAKVVRTYRGATETDFFRKDPDNFSGGTEDSFDGKAF